MEQYIFREGEYELLNEYYTALLENKIEEKDKEKWQQNYIKWQSTYKKLCINYGYSKYTLDNHGNNNIINAYNYRKKAIWREAQIDSILMD